MRPMIYNAGVDTASRGLGENVVAVGMRMDFQRSMGTSPQTSHFSTCPRGCSMVGFR